MELNQRPNNKLQNKKNEKRLRKKFITKKNTIHYEFKNPLITKFNLDSQIYYDINEVDIYFSKIKDKNCLKVTGIELDFINKKIEEIELSKESRNTTKFISIEKNIFDCI